AHGSELARPKEQRRRSKSHLLFVREQAPSEAHHLEFAQPRALGRCVGGTSSMTGWVCVYPEARTDPRLRRRRRSSKIFCRSSDAHHGAAKLCYGPDDL